MFLIQIIYFYDNCQMTFNSIILFIFIMFWWHRASHLLVYLFIYITDDNCIAILLNELKSFTVIIVLQAVQDSASPFKEIK